MLKRQNNKNYSYFTVSFVALFFGVMVCAVMFKTPPVNEYIAYELNISTGQASLLFSVFTFVSCIFSIPCIFFIKKIGAKKLIVIGSIFLIVGSIIGVISFIIDGFNFELIFVSRCLEGVCYVFANICTPIMIAYSVPKEKKGISLAIFSAFVPIGSLVGNFFTPILVTNFDFCFTWLAYCILFTLAASLTFIVFNSDDPRLRNKQKVHDKMIEKNNLGSLSDKIFFVSSFALFCIIQISIINFFPKKLNLVFGLDLSLAGLIGTLPAIISVFIGVVFGCIADKQKTFKNIYLFGLICVTVGVFFIFWGLEEFLIVGFIFASIGLASPSVYVFACIELFSKKNATFGIAFCICACCLSMTIGNMICMLFLGPDILQWKSLSIVLTIISTLAVVCTLFCKPKSFFKCKKKSNIKKSV